MRIPANVGSTDRIIRFLLGLGALGFGITGPLADVGTTIAAVAGALLVVTAAVGYCPLYGVLGINTHDRTTRPRFGRG
jgi:hypothetical protein